METGAKVGRVDATETNTFLEALDPPGRGEQQYSQEVLKTSRRARWCFLTGRKVGFLLKDLYNSKCLMEREVWVDEVTKADVLERLNPSYTRATAAAAATARTGSAVPDSGINQH